MASSKIVAEKVQKVAVMFFFVLETRKYLKKDCNIEEAQGSQFEGTLNHQACRHVS